MVANSLGPSVTQLPMVAIGFLFPSFATKSLALTLGGMAFLVGVPSFPFG
jgi:hypothetical protein